MPQIVTIGYKPTVKRQYKCPDCGYHVHIATGVAGVLCPGVNEETCTYSYYGYELSTEQRASAQRLDCLL